MPASLPFTRIAALSNHLLPPSMPTPSKPPITCHVLDTTLGRPAPRIPVSLTLHDAPSLTFTATTDADGRVTSWTPSSPFSADTLDVVFRRDGDQKWSLSFETEAYFADAGATPFFPEVRVVFRVGRDEKDEHFHVPVLLGRFGYTTYRGS